MGIQSEFKALINELDRIHSGAIPWSDDNFIPDFVTTENGGYRYFTPKARQALELLAKTMYANRQQKSIKVEIGEYSKFVRQAVSDIHSAEDGVSFDGDDQQHTIEKLRSMVEERLAASVIEFTHYLPAWTLGIESEGAFYLGPVTILNRSDWIDSVDFSQQAKERYLNDVEYNCIWKEVLKEALLQGHDDKNSLRGLANEVYKAINGCPAIIEISIRGYEQKFSRKLARMIGKNALDAISLGFGSPECFQQQALQDERLPPYRSYSLTATNGMLWLPGSALSNRVRSHSPSQLKKAMVDLKSFFTAVGAILEGLVDPSTHKHPKLAMRWSTALDWYGEGIREPSDAIAIAKLATCLDVLSCGGKSAGIRDMVIHITGIRGDTEVVQNPTKTLTQVVKAIYDDGRSRILHGTHSDRLRAFEAVRHQAAYLARISLMESAVRLESYLGKDIEDAFRTI